MHDATRKTISMVRETIQAVSDTYQELMTICQQKKNLFIVCVRFHMNVKQVGPIYMNLWVCVLCACTHTIHVPHTQYNLMHAYMHTCTHTFSHRAHTHHTHAHTHMPHICTPYKHAHRPHTCAHTCTHTHTHTLHMHTHHTRTNTHTHTHTHTHVHTHTPHSLSSGIRRYWSSLLHSHWRNRHNRLGDHIADSNPLSFFPSLPPPFYPPFHHCLPGGSLPPLPHRLIPGLYDSFTSDCSEGAHQCSAGRTVQENHAEDRDEVSLEVE